MNNHAQFMQPVCDGIKSVREKILVAKACDAAILFGVLEYLNGNESLRVPKEQLQAIYDGKIAEINGALRQ